MVRQSAIRTVNHCSSFFGCDYLLVAMAYMKCAKRKQLFKEPTEIGLTTTIKC